MSNGYPTVQLELECGRCGKYTKWPGYSELGTSWFKGNPVCDHCGARHDLEGELLDEDPESEPEPQPKLCKGLRWERARPDFSVWDRAVIAEADDLKPNGEPDESKPGSTTQDRGQHPARDADGRVTTNP